MTPETVLMFRSSLRLAVVLGIGLQSASIADGQTRIQVLPIETITITTRQFLAGDQAAPPTIVGGELRIPPSLTGKLPAVVLVHGSNGVQGYHARWADQLNSIGVAAFTLDSFGGRGLGSTANDQNQLDTLAMTVDAYRALGVLARHPQIDGNRIAVKGFSKGAAAALYSSMERFRQRYGPSSVRFAAHIGLYNSCHAAYKDEANVSGAPIRLFHGEADDWTPISQCREYVERLRKKGVDIALIGYPGAHHAYDNFERKGEPEFISDAQTVRNCGVIEDDRGLVNSRTGRPFTINDDCVERGVHVAYQEAATTATTNAIKDFLSSVFGLQSVAR
jgi:dienelactone hydrolase